MLDENWLANQLIERGLISQEQHRTAVAAEGDDLCLNLLTSGAIQEHDLLRFLGLYYHTRYVTTEKLHQASVPQWVLDLLPSDFCEQFTVVPVRCDKQRMVLSVVTPDPNDARVKEMVQRTSMAREVHTYVALQHSVQAAIRKWYKGDIHAFDRVDRMLGQGYPQMLDIYDQRLIDLDDAPAPTDSTESLELETDPPAAAAAASYQPTRPAQPQTPPPQQHAPRPRESVPTAPVPPVKPAEPAALAPAPTKQDEGLEQLVDEPTDETVTQLQEAFFKTCSVLVNLLEMGQGWRQGHSVEVARLVEALAERVGFAKEDLWKLRLAALVHELGKPAEPHLTLLALDGSAELRALARRVYLTPVKLLESAGLPESVSEILSAQYERPDAKGVPGKLSGSDVPLGARLLAVVDAFADMLSNPRTPEGRTPDQNEAIERLRSAVEMEILDSNAVEMFCKVTSGDALREQLLGDRQRILVIDADAESTTVLEMKLVSAGYDVRVVRTTAEAAREMLAGTVDLILSEVDLKPVDGFGFLKRIRADTRTRGVPLVFLSERSEADDMTRGFELGAADFIVKPYTSELLLAKIKVAMSRRPSDARGVSGSLTEMSLPDILQILSAGRKSGKLRLEFPDENGEIFLDEGAIVQARFGDLKGVEAFYAIVPKGEGRFELDPNAKIPEREIEGSTESLVLEAMRRFDEYSHNR